MGEKTVWKYRVLWVLDQVVKGDLGSLGILCDCGKWAKGRDVFGANSLQSGLGCKACENGGY